MSNVKKAEREEGRRTRVPFSGRRANLQLSEAERKALDEAGYVPRWVNDRDGRVERALAGGYEFVKPEEATSIGIYGDVHKGNTDIGDKVSKVVSRGEPIIRAYLMKIKKEYYEEDQKAKESVNKKVDKALSGGEAGGSGVENKYGPGVTYGR